MSLRKWLTTIVIVPLVLVVCLTAGLLALAQATRQAEGDAQQVSAIYSAVEELATTLLQAENEARAYAATHNARDLEAYRISREGVQFQFAQLYDEARVEPALAGQLPELERLATEVLGGANSETFSIAQKRFADVAYALRSRRLDGLTRLWAASIAVLVFAALCGLISTIALGLVAQRHLARRIERVEERARRYTSGQDLPDPPPVGGHDEIARLDDALRTMSTTIAEREAELRLALGEAEAASRSKSAFLATISHELRTPLNGVIGMSELLAEASLPAREHECATTIHTSSELLLGIVNDILDFSKLSAAAVSLSLANVALEQLVASTAAVFATQAQHNGVALHVAFDAGVPATVLADELRVRQVLGNLIGNAVKFTPSGSVTVSVTSQCPSAERALVTFEIADTGIGVPENMRETIFEPFQQADMSKTRRYGGTGLGLSISRHLVTMMGGTISLHPANGPGSVFSVTIPFDVVTAEASAPPASTEAPGVPTVRGEIQPRTENILLVEDNEINQRVAARLLQRLGLQIQIAANGREALDALERGHYDLVFMDLQMPVMDGFEASTEVRRREAVSGEHVPIVAMTANALPEDREACFAVGMDDHVGKPVKLAELQRVLNRWLPKSAES